MSGAIAVHHGAFGRAAIYDLDKPIVPHAHREAHLIFYVDGDRASVTVGGEVCRLDRRNAVAISPWNPHSFELPDHDHSSCMCLVLYIKPMWFLEYSKSVANALRFGSCRIDMTPTITAWATRLTSLLLEDTASERFDGFLFETTRQCFEQSWLGQDQNALVHGARGRYVDYRVRKALGLIQERFSEDLEIDWLAREAGLSRPHFFKLFKRQMGITPNLYLNTLRSEQAIDDLMTTGKTVTDIGYDLGFSSQASFTRFFSSNVGIPPSDYRRVAHIA